MAMRRHKDTNGKPLPQTKEKIALQVIWDKMKDRTTNDKHWAYKNYGGKGIRVEFKSFGEFYEWSLNSGFKVGLTIDRIDNAKGYNKDNCRFATRLEQSQNKSTGKKNKNGYTGVKSRGNKFIASCTYNNNENYLGTFDTPEEASLAYKKFKKKITDNYFEDKC
jgi:hypothetical protein